MAMQNPVGRVNYEPNSWSGDGAGPREDPVGGFHSFEEQIDGTKARVRSEKFADHYSQARQFYISQTPVEQAHIVDAFVFELSKCEQPGIRARMVANLRNVDDDFARRVADGLRLDPLPEPSQPARQPITDLPPSPALSIVLNGPDSFAGRKIGALVTDGTDAALLAALREAATAEGALVELVAPQIGGVVTSDGQLRARPPEDRRRPVGPLRRRGHPRHGRGGRPARQGRRHQGLHQRRPRPLQVSSASCQKPRPCSRTLSTSTTDTSRSTVTQRSPRSSNTAGRCATGTAPPPSTKPERLLRRQPWAPGSDQVPF